MIEANIQDPKPLIILCDKNGLIKEMVKYLWENQMRKYIEVYVLKVNQRNTGQVLGNLMDLGADEDYIRELLLVIGSNCDTEELIREFEQRNKERLLEDWL